MTSKQTLEDFLAEVAESMERHKSVESELAKAIDLIGCLQVENDDLKAQLKKRDNESV
jgi:FtsZ-binding cell division protein ZapB